MFITIKKIRNLLGWGEDPAEQEVGLETAGFPDMPNQTVIPQQVMPGAPSAEPKVVTTMDEATGLTLSKPLETMPGAPDMEPKVMSMEEAIGLFSAITPSAAGFFPYRDSPLPTLGNMPPDYISESPMGMLAIPQ